MTGVLTAGSGSAWESTLVAVLDAGTSEFEVVRRCVDLAELLTEAGTGRSSLAVIAADLRQLDAETLARLRSAAITSVVVHPADDEAAAGQLLQMGADRSVPDDLPAGEWIALLTRADQELRRAAAAPSWSDPRAALGRSTGLGPSLQGPAGRSGAAGAVVAVWGPTGAPGRTTVATGLAVAAAGAGRPTLLIDADVYGGVLASSFGLLDENPGLVGVCRTAAQGRLTVPEFATSTWAVGDQLRLLTGIARADRWPEVRPSALPAVLAVAREFASLTVVDCGFCLETDEELSFDTLAPRRNGATLAVLEDADLVLAVGSADPPGMERLIRGLAELGELIPISSVRVVLNRLRRSAAGGVEAEGALQRFTGLTPIGSLPEDRVTTDRAWRAGVPPARVGGNSPLVRALTNLTTVVQRELGATVAW